MTFPQVGRNVITLRFELAMLLLSCPQWVLVVSERFEGFVLHRQEIESTLSTFK